MSSTQAAAVDPAVFEALKDAIIELRGTLATMSGSGNNTSSNALYDLFDSSNPHNLNTRTGLEAMNQASAPLKMDGIEKWDGNVLHFPNFLLALKDRFQECNWDADDASGIMKIKISTPGATATDPPTVVEKNILEDYHSITMKQIIDAYNAITDDRAKQNHKAMFKAAKGSITGDIRTTTLETPDNKPQQNNGWAILKSFTDSTTVASLAVAIKASSKLLDFDPAAYKFNIPVINKELNRLFILATTPQRIFSQMERIQLTLTAYDRIKQPYEWTLWVKEVKRDFTKNQVLNCQDMMNEGVTTYNTIKEDDTMYMEDALRQPDREQFIKAMTKELEDHIKRGHWKIVPISSVPKHKLPLPMVWSMKRKRDPTGEIIKWKARLCAGGHKSIEFIDYWATYSPVVSWNTVRLMIVMALINDWHMQSIDFVLAFPQAPVKTDIYMKPPKVPRSFSIPDLPNYADRFNKVYKLIKNLYGLKDASKTWFDFLKKGLDKRGWKQSEIDTCLFTKNGIILVVYVDDAILISPYKGLIQREIKSLQEEYDLTDDGILKDYLGTRFIRRTDGSIELSQPKMIERVLKIVGLNSRDEHIKLHDTPADSRTLLDNDPNGKPRKQSWNYRSAVGCLSYLQAMIRPDITFAVQQAARFCNNPQRQHEEAVKRICRYLIKTKQQGLILKPDKNKGLECYVDADWAGSWQDRSSNDPLSSHSRTGFVIMYAGCPIMWSSKLQSLISLSTTEAEYIALSSALREVIAIMHLMEELRQRGFKLYSPTPKITCRTFEDNKSCIEIATNHKTRARTKHLSVRLHHFRHHVVNKTITIEHVSTLDQLADAFTKPLARDQFTTLRDRIMTWRSTISKDSILDQENRNPQLQ